MSDICFDIFDNSKGVAIKIHDYPPNIWSFTVNCGNVLNTSPNLLCTVKIHYSIYVKAQMSTNGYFVFVAATKYLENIHLGGTITNYYTQKSSFTDNCELININSKLKITT